MIKRMSQAMGVALVDNSFSLIASKISFHMKKESDWSRPDIYKALKLFWLLNWVSIARMVARFHQASWSRPAATAANPKRPSGCFCARLSDKPKLCQSAAPRAQPLILQSKPSTVFCQMTGRGSNLGSNLNSAAWSTGCKGFICSEAQKSTVWGLNSFQNAKIEDSSESIPTLVHQTMIGTGIKGLTSGGGTNMDLKLQNTVTEWTAWGFL